RVLRGDVIVTTMTTPDYIAAMEKAAAFVTDEGGITCHAAIIAREMEKPCIIGTQNATQVLKDGDLVEVDADRGVVRILNSEPKDSSAKNQNISFPQSSGDWYRLLAREGVDITTISGLDVVFFDLTRRFGGDRSQRFFTYVNNTNFTHYIGVEPRELGRAVYREYFRNSTQIKMYYQAGLRLLQRVKTQSNAWSRRLRHKPDAKILLRAFLVFRKQFEEVNRIYSIISWLGIESWQADFEEKLNIMIARNKLEKRQGEIALSVYKPWKKTALIEIQEKLASGMSPKQLAGEYQFLRSWSVVWHRPITAEWVASLGKAEKDKKLKTLELQRVMKLLKPSKEETSFLSLAPYIVFFKDWRDDVRRSHAYFWVFLFEKIAKKFGVRADDIGYLTLDEIESSLRGGQFDTESIQHRKEKACAIVEQDGRALVVGAPLPKEADEIISAVNASQQQLTVRGTIAQKGFARGVVRVVRSYHDIKHVHEGDILVANTTHPNYLPAMQKAAAFVTNEGGAISHAAIVAREMKKPCIVGTGNATQVLKDGILVEVDADKGVVRILDRK
ncbi:MAG: PEP-utilizing enzyme, partial [Patescibacteria group bacterium]